MKQVLLAVALLLSPLVASAQSNNVPTRDELFKANDPVLEQISQANWSTTGQSVSQLPLSKHDVQTFVEMVRANHGKIPQAANDYPKPSELVRSTIGDWQFVDLDNDGTFELIATTDTSQSFFFNDVFVIRHTKDPLRYAVQHLRQQGGQSLREILQDLNGDGKQELVLNQLLTSGRAGEPQVTYPAVFKLDHGTYVEASSDFSKYYSITLIPDLRQSIQDRQAAGASAQDLELLQLQLDKELRISGNMLAGEIDAEWRAKSPISSQRLLAVAVLRDIAVTQCNFRAWRYLVDLTRDWDARVVEDANIAINDISFACPVLS